MNPSEHDIREAVRQRFDRLARSADREKKFPVGPASALALGYNPDEVGALPASVTESFAGVGDPLALDELRLGHVVLDLG